MTRLERLRFCGDGPVNPGRGNGDDAPLVIRWNDPPPISDEQIRALEAAAAELTRRTWKIARLALSVDEADLITCNVILRYLETLEGV
jgi:hypothetical protein